MPSLTAATAVKKTRLPTAYPTDVARSLLANFSSDEAGSVRYRIPPPFCRTSRNARLVTMNPPRNSRLAKRL